MRTEIIHDDVQVLVGCQDFNQVAVGHTLGERYTRLPTELAGHAAGISATRVESGGTPVFSISSAVPV